MVFPNCVAYSPRLFVGFAVWLCLLVCSVSLLCNTVLVICVVLCSLFGLCFLDHAINLMSLRTLAHECESMFRCLFWNLIWLWSPFLVSRPFLIRGLALRMFERCSNSVGELSFIMQFTLCLCGVCPMIVSGAFDKRFVGYGSRSECLNKVQTLLVVVVRLLCLLSGLWATF